MLCYKTKKNVNLIFGHCCCFSHPIHLVSTIIEMQQHLNKVNNRSRIHVKITCRVFDPSLNNKTTVTYVMMQTTQKDSFFKIIQRAKKLVSDSLGLVDFAIGLVKSVFNLPDGQVMFMRNSNNRRSVESILLDEKLLGLVR